MDEFTASIGAVTLVPLADGKRFRLLYPVEYRYGDSVWVVPAGTVTDFASIPGIGRVFLPKWGLYGWAAIWHDYAYAGNTRLSRLEIDRTFLRFMKVRDAPLWQQVLIYASVRAFGWMFFNK